MVDDNDHGLGSGSSTKNNNFPTQTALFHGAAAAAATTPKDDNHVIYLISVDKRGLTNHY